jgi:hypothetical protein
MKKDPAVLLLEIQWLRSVARLLRLSDRMEKLSERRKILSIAWTKISPMCADSQRKGSPMRLAVRLLVEALHARLPSQTKGRVL